MNKEICIAQIEVVSGDIKGNTARICEVVEHSTAEVIAFGELSVTGYNCGNLFLNDKFLKEAEEALDEIISKVPFNKIVIVGSVFKNGNKLYNSAFVLYGKRIHTMYHKIHLAGDGHHEDQKYFTAGTDIKVCDINDFKFAPIICEDAWNTTRDLYEELKNENVDIVFSLNASYNSFNKKQIRKDVFKKKQNFIPTIYTNCVGIGDCVKNYYTYDGSSMIIDKNQTFVTIPSFEVLNFEVHFNPLTKEFSGTMYDQMIDVHVQLSTRSTRDYEKFVNILDMTTYGIKKSFELSGVKKAQVHMSGGLDSSVVGYLTVRALGKENVVFISQPSKNNGEQTKNNAQTEADVLGVELIWDNIQEYVETYKTNHPNSSPIEIATFEATVRSSLGLANTHRYKTAIISCGTHVENTLGFFTFHDIGSIGLLQPIGDLTKSEIYKLARFINVLEDKEIIPSNLYDGSQKPSAELEDNKGEDPYDYEIMSIVCSELVRENNWDDESIKEKVDIKYPQFEQGYNINDVCCRYTDQQVCDYIKLAKKLVKQTSYKRGQSAPVLILNDKLSFGFSMRDPLINRWDG